MYVYNCSLLDAIFRSKDIDVQVMCVFNIKHDIFHILVTL